MAAIAMITFVLGYMLTDDSKSGGRVQVLLSVLVAALVVAFAVIRERVVRRGQAEQAQSGLKDSLTRS
jgi:GABA permease